MNRIFLTLTIVSGSLLIAAFVLGLNIELSSQQSLSIAERTALRTHFLTALAGLGFAALLHAICFTYFMGTGRWLEETTDAYHLSDEPVQESRKMKYKVLGGIGCCIILLVATGALGAAIDPGANLRLKGWDFLSPATIHFLIAATTICVNLLVNIFEYQSITRNGQIIQNVMDDIRRIRIEKGLPT